MKSVLIVLFAFAFVACSQKTKNREPASSCMAKKDWKAYYKNQKIQNIPDGWSLLMKKKVKILAGGERSEIFGTDKVRCAFSQAKPFPQISLTVSKTKKLGYEKSFRAKKKTVSIFYKKIKKNQDYQSHNFFLTETLYGKPVYMECITTSDITTSLAAFFEAMDEAVGVCVPYPREVQDRSSETSTAA